MRTGFVAAVVIVIALAASAGPGAALASGTWQSVGPTPRDHGPDLTMTVLRSGDVLVVGGRVGDTTAVDIFEPSTNSWRVAAPLPTGRYAHSATLLTDGRVLVAGGVTPATDPGCTELTDLYDPATNAWSSGPSMARARCFHAAVPLPDGRVLVIGGIDDGGAGTAEIFDAASNSWTMTPPMRSRVSDGMSATLLPRQARVLVVGGSVFSGGLSMTTAQEYLIATDRWSSVPEPTPWLYQHAATLLADGRVFFSGGNSYGVPPSVEIYDPATRAWSLAPKMLSDTISGAPFDRVFSRWAHTATQLQSSRVLVAGGFPENSPPEEYDPYSESWTAVGGGGAEPRGWHAATALPDGRVLTVGGIADRARSAALYTPAELLAEPNAADCAPAWGTFGGTLWPPACWRPYASTSALNMPIPTDPKLAPNSAAIVDRVRTSISPVPIPKNMVAHETQNWGEPTFYSDPSDPVFSIVCTESYGGQPCPLTSLRIPLNAVVEDSADRHLTVVDQSSWIEYNMWHVVPPIADADRSVTIGWGGMTPIAGDARSTTGNATASYLGGLAGRVRVEELRAGRIEHALNITIDCDSGAHVYPALWQGAKCGDPVNAPPMGSLFQLNMTRAEIALLDAPAWQKTILRAAAKYGMYLGDTGASGGILAIEEESGGQYRSAGLPDPWVQFAARNGWERQVDGSWGGRWRDPAIWTRLRVIDPCEPERTCVTLTATNSRQTVRPNNSLRFRLAASAGAHVRLRVTIKIGGTSQHAGERTIIVPSRSARTVEIKLQPRITRLVRRALGLHKRVDAIVAARSVSELTGQVGTARLRVAIVQ